MHGGHLSWIAVALRLPWGHSCLVRGGLQRPPGHTAYATEELDHLPHRFDLGWEPGSQPTGLSFPRWTTSSAARSAVHAAALHHQLRLTGSRRVMSCKYHMGLRCRVAVSKLTTSQLKPWLCPCWASPQWEGRTSLLSTIL